MKLIEILKKARELITKETTWIKNQYQRGNAFCAAGACREAIHILNSGYKHERFTQERETFESLKMELPEGFPKNMGFGPQNSVIDFNDRPTTTHQEILNLFDRTIETAETA